MRRPDDPDWSWQDSFAGVDLLPLEAPEGAQVAIVRSLSGETYRLLLIPARAPRCTCPGAIFHRKCYHAPAVERMKEEGHL